MSDFDDAMQEGFAEALEIFGAKPFTFRGIKLTGDFSDLSADEKLAIGGSVPNVKQTLMFAFREFKPPIRTGEYIECGPRKLRIGLVEQDAIAYTLYLCSPDE